MLRTFLSHLRVKIYGERWDDSKAQLILGNKEFGKKKKRKEKKNVTEMTKRATK
jgi:hypothetical protein